MRSAIAIFDSHWTALDAVEVLKNESYPVDKLSIIGRAKIVDNDWQRKSIRPPKKKNRTVGIVLGSSFGVLPSARILPVPEMGFVFGAGAIVGAIASFNAKLKGIKMGTLLRTVGIKKENIGKYSNEINEGNFLVVAQGKDEDLSRASIILHKQGYLIEINNQQ